METTETPRRAATRKAADALGALTRIDTLLADLYLQRARDLLSTELGEADFRALHRAQTEADLLPDRIRGAMGIQDWKVVQELSARLSSLKRRLAETQDLRTVAQRVYDFDEVLIDPFSPGLRALAGVAASGLGALRDTGIRLLESLCAADPAWRDLYETRILALRAAQVDGGPEPEPGASGSDPARLQSEAVEALARGDLRRVQEISVLLQRGVAAAPPGTGGASGSGPRTGPLAQDLTLVFPDEVIARARPLGLAPAHLASVRGEVEEIFRNAWQPRPGGAEQAGLGPVRLTVALPADVPEALREHLEMYLDRPFVNSTGGRYLPPLGEEDLLVEDFDEAPAGAPPPNLPLLERLGLDRRSGLSRARLERALLEKGTAVVSALGLDPRAFRLACIPPDVYVRLGQLRGWGTQPQWTHFDGYMFQNRRWIALAGGDSRFGGVFDAVGLGRDNDLDNLTARFVVLQRRRLAGWHAAWPDPAGRA